MITRKDKFYSINTNLLFDSPHRYDQLELQKLIEKASVYTFKEERLYSTPGISEDDPNAGLCTSSKRIYLDEKGEEWEIPGAAIAYVDVALEAAEWNLEDRSKDKETKKLLAGYIRKVKVVITEEGA